MSGRPATGQLERALTRLTVGLVQAQELKAQLGADQYTGEADAQIQLQFSGKAGNAYASTDKKVPFQYPFLHAPQQREVPFDQPHFVGATFELLNATASLVVLGVQLIGWGLNKSNWTIGAELRLYAFAPLVDASTLVPFSALAHLTFEGYLAHVEGGGYT
jgi:hypothetical protein